MGFQKHADYQGQSAEGVHCVPSGSGARSILAQVGSGESQLFEEC